MVTGDIYCIPPYTTTHHHNYMGRSERGEIQTLELTPIRSPCESGGVLLFVSRVACVVESGIGGPVSPLVFPDPGTVTDLAARRTRSALPREYRLRKCLAAVITDSGIESGFAYKKRPQPANPSAFRGPIPHVFLDVVTGYCIAPGWHIVSPPAGILYRPRLAYCIAPGWHIVSPPAGILYRPRLAYCIAPGWHIVSPPAGILYRPRLAYCIAPGWHIVSPPAGISYR